MGFINALLTREQQASKDFYDASGRLLAIAEDGHGQGLATFAGHLVEAVNSFGLSELHARQAERLQALKLRAEFSKASTALTKSHNDKGLRNLELARQGLKLFREEVSSYPETGIERELKNFQRELREQLVTLEIKADDVRKLDAALQEGLTAASKGARALPDYLEHNLAELEQARRSANRGAVENIPIWKIAAIVVALGVWIWALFRCTWWGSCSLAEGLAYAVIFWIAAIIARFC